MHFVTSLHASPGRRIVHLCLALIACLPMLAGFGLPPYAVAGPSGFATSEFETLWARTDGLVAGGQVSRGWLWGPAPSTQMDEPYAGQVQYFDKARMELNRSVSDPASPWRVTTGLLVSEMVSGRIQMGAKDFAPAAPSSQVVAGDVGPRYSDFEGAAKLKSADRTGEALIDSLAAGGAVTPTSYGSATAAKYITETGHNIPDVFWEYMTQAGKVRTGTGEIVEETLFDWVYVMGYPITEAYWAVIKVGGTEHIALVQLFQRRSLTYVADFAPGWQVQMGNVGQHYFQWRYTEAKQPIAIPQATPTATRPRFPATGKLVGIEGDDFIYQGSAVKLKGTNYWLSATPFSGTWATWNGPLVREELGKAKELGVNTVRIGLPYDHRDTRDIVWGDGRRMLTISPWIISQMTQVLQIAASYDMKVIFVLFEWYDEQPATGTPEAELNLTYLKGIIGPFANDDRVLAWDLHNEPDHYDNWKDGKQDQVIKWLERMARHVREIDTRHPITVGVGNYASLWYPANDGTTILSFVDFVAFHTYSAGALSGQIKELKRRTTKPVLLEEMGWPTSPGSQPPTPGAVYDEATQSFLYNSMLADSKALDIAGVVQWTLWDYAPGATVERNFEEHFGLVRRDGSFKPAAQIFREQYVAFPLSSDTRTNVPLDTADRPRHKP
jgi:hypothetical protein